MDNPNWVIIIARIRGLVETVFGAFLILGVVLLYTQRLQNASGGWGAIYQVIMVILAPALIVFGILSFVRPTKYLRLNYILGIALGLLALYVLASNVASHSLIAGVVAALVYLLVCACLLFLTSRIDKS